jgi:hypothetical protein
MGGAELRKKSRICSKSKGLRSTKTTPLTQQVLPAQLLESIVAKNGVRSRVHLGVMNERPPTFIVNAPLSAAPYLDRWRLWTSCNGAYADITKRTHPRDRHECFEKHAPHSDTIRYSLMWYDHSDHPAQPQACAITPTTDELHAS